MEKSAKSTGVLATLYFSGMGSTGSIIPAVDGRFPASGGVPNDVLMDVNNGGAEK
jgi:hypothetical protein